jgi:hypothetical protein
MKNKRPGRPTLPEETKKKAISAKLPPDLITWLNNQDISRNKLIEEAVVKTYDLCPHCYRSLHKFHNCEINPTSKG